VTSRDAAAGEVATLAPERQVRHRGLVQEALQRLLRNRLAVAAAAILILLGLVAVFAPVFATHELSDTDFAAGKQYQGASADHWLGTDGLGRDWYSRLVHGTRTSMKIGVFSQLITLAIGLPIGLMAGYAGGRTDNLLMRFTDMVYAFPSLLLILLIAQVRGPSINNIILAIGIVGWTDIARLVRGQVQSLRGTEFILAAHSVGATGGRIMARHLLPNTLGPIIVAVTFGIPNAIFAEAALSFIGVGLPLGTPSWGTMVNQGYAAIDGSQVLVIAPATVIAVTLLAFTFLGDGLRDALDPRTR
jgi:oligopeptide transport system permease protein